MSLLEISQKYKYLIIYTDQPPTLHLSLREMSDIIGLNYSTISKHLANLPHKHITNNENKEFIIKRLIW